MEGHATLIIISTDNCIYTYREILAVLLHINNYRIYNTALSLSTNNCIHTYRVIL